VPGGALSDPLDYPWTDGVALAAPGPRTGRAVVAVGSNAAPAVLRAKLRRHGVSTDVAVAPVRVIGVAVGQSAHVSVGGYIAAAPYAAPGRVADLQVSWLDDDQLAALDATEPNYDRVTFGVVDLYVSKWGVLGIAGVPIEFTTQRALYEVLARNGADGGVIDPTDAPSTIARLQQPGVRDRLRDLWAQQGFAISPGLPAV
jgi:hypothetical protein